MSNSVEITSRPNKKKKSKMSMDQEDDVVNPTSEVNLNEEAIINVPLTDREEVYKQRRKKKSRIRKARQSVQKPSKLFKTIDTYQDPNGMKRSPSKKSITSKI